MKIATIATLLLATWCGPRAGFADLPGLPPAAPAEGVRPSEHHKEPIVTETGPVRGSLFKQGAAAVTVLGADGQPIPGAQGAPVSFMAVQSEQPRKYKKNDIITVVISEASDSTTNGKGTNNKTQAFDMALQQFVQLAVGQLGLPNIESVATPNKLPEVKFQYNNNTSTDASQERQDTVSARISATIIDVKPNGTMEIEAVKQIKIDKEEQSFKLSGICRVEDVASDNTILSTQLANLTFSKQTQGQVKDNDKRGWLNGFIDKFSPF